MASKRTANDTVRMAPLTPVALGGVPRRRPLRMPEQTSSMKARMQRALERIMHRLEVAAPAEADPR